MKNLRLFVALIAVVILGVAFLVFVNDDDASETVRTAQASESVPVQAAHPAAVAADAAPIPIKAEADRPDAPELAVSDEEELAPAAKSSKQGSKTEAEPEIAVAPMTPDALAKVAALVKEQNDYRQKLGLTLLAVSTDLQADSAKLVQQNITRACAPNVARKLVRGKDVAFVWEPALPRYSGPPAAQALEPRYIVDMWKTGRRELGADGKSCGNSDDCNSYLKMTRPTARKIGCAMAVCPNQAQVWICSYGD